MGDLFHKLLFAARFQDPNIVLSSLVNSESKILFDREPVTRVAKVAPWLTIDGDPYPVVVDGRVKWIVDAYTTTSSYPYSSRTTLSDATADALTATTTSVATLPSERINYLRNSVKAVVDAYDGTVTLYAWDTEDPLLQTWTKAFGGIVTPVSEAPAELVAHFRYPEDLFKVQRTILSRYHVEDPASFYNGQDFWTIPIDPTNRAVNALQPPYYLTLRMPGTAEPKFSLTTTFAPQKRQTLAAFMAVDSAPGPTYGTIRVLQLPRNTTVPGPDPGAEQLRVRAGDRRAADAAAPRRGRRGVRQPAVAAGQRRDALRGAGLRAGHPGPGLPAAAQGAGELRRHDGPAQLPARRPSSAVFSGTRDRGRRHRPRDRSG